MTSWSLFPPTTAEVQFDEKWSFVGRKEKNCVSDNATAGDCWDHTAIDPESRLIVSLVVGKRTAASANALVRDFRARTGGRLMRLMTSDEYSAYPEAILATYGRLVQPRRTGRPGRPREPYVAVPRELTYATVHKERENNRVVRVSRRVVFGTARAVDRGLAQSRVSRTVNTSFMERHNATDRHRCSRKIRKTYQFSKEWTAHQAATRFSYFSYNFCWPVRTLRAGGDEGPWQPRTPAMAAGLTDHVWSLAEWLTFPAQPVQRE